MRCDMSKITISLMFFLSVIVFMGSFNIAESCIAVVSPPGVSPCTSSSSDDYFTTIQEAVNYVGSEGGILWTITVCPGEYIENVDVLTNPGINIYSFSGSPSDTIIRSAADNKHVFNITSSPGSVSISGFTITGTVPGQMCGDDLCSGVYVWASSAGISNNYITGNNAGITYRDRNNFNISNNNISLNSRGINLINATGSTINDNYISYNNEGISLDNTSYNNTIYHNDIIGNNIQASDNNLCSNSWYDPTLLEGNYWSDYSGLDDGSGTGKHAIAGDGIGDTLIPHPSACYDDNPYIDSFVTCTDNDGDGYAIEGGICGLVDCNDSDPDVNPGAPEGPYGDPACSDTIDNDCDGLTDAGDPNCTLLCTDNDNDTYAVEGGYCGVVDCNDNDSSVYPGAPDIICDGVDNNCDGTPDDGYIPSNTTCGVGVCQSTGQLICQNGQLVDTCVPGSPTGNDDNCNGIDENCNGTPDENYVPPPTTCGVGVCQSTGQLICQNGSLVDTCVPGSPQTEICDGLDNDCDGQIDEGVLNTYYRDADADTYGNPAISIQACTPPPGYVTNNLDCNDNDPVIGPCSSNIVWDYENYHAVGNACYYTSTCDSYDMYGPPLPVNASASVYKPPPGPISASSSSDITSSDMSVTTSVSDGYEGLPYGSANDQFTGTFYATLPEFKFSYSFDYTISVYCGNYPDLGYYAISNVAAHLKVTDKTDSVPLLDQTFINGSIGCQSDYNPGMFSDTDNGSGELIVPVRFGHEIEVVFDNSGYSEAYGCPASGNTNFTLQYNTAITACSDYLLVRNVRTHKYYSSLQAAYDDPETVDGDIIQSKAVTLIENPDFYLTKSVTIQGGYDCDFNEPPTGKTILNGNMTVNNGTVTIENFILQ